MKIVIKQLKFFKETKMSTVHYMFKGLACTRRWSLQLTKLTKKRIGRTIISTLFNDAKTTCGDDFVQEENHEAKQFDPSMNLGFNLENIINLDDFSQSFGPNCSQFNNNQSW